MPQNNRFPQGNGPPIVGMNGGTYNHRNNYPNQLNAGSNGLKLDSQKSDEDTPVENINGISGPAPSVAPVELYNGSTPSEDLQQQSLPQQSQPYANITNQAYPAAPSPNTGLYSTGPPQQYMVDTNMIGEFCLSFFVA